MPQAPEQSAENRAHSVCALQAEIRHEIYLRDRGEHFGPHRHLKGKTPEETTALRTAARTAQINAHDARVAVLRGRLSGL